MSFEDYAKQLTELTKEECVSFAFIFLGKLDGVFKTEINKNKALTRDQILQLIKESIETI